MVQLELFGPRRVLNLEAMLRPALISALAVLLKPPPESEGTREPGATVHGRVVRGRGAGG
jgi:hypothetical protein